MLHDLLIAVYVVVGILIYVALLLIGKLFMPENRYNDGPRGLYPFVPLKIIGRRRDTGSRILIAEIKNPSISYRQGRRTVTEYEYDEVQWMRAALIEAVKHTVNPEYQEITIEAEDVRSRGHHWHNVTLWINGHWVA